MARRYRWLAFVWLVVSLCAGCEPGAKQTSLPAGILSQPQIYVSDWANHRIVRMNDMRGGGWETYGDGRGTQQAFHFPVGICLDAAGRIYISEQSHERILRQDDMLGTNWTTFLPPEMASKRVNKFAGSWICVDRSGRIYVTYDGEHQIVRMDNMSGANRVTFGSEGGGAGQFHYPAGIAVDDENRIYVADFDNFRIVQIDDIRGANWTTFGSYGSGRSEFINPCGICLDQQGRIYVADQGNDRIVRIDDMRGTNWTTTGSFGTAAELWQLPAPTGICVDRTGRIYVTQCSSNHRIVRMDDMNGTNWMVFGSGGTGVGNFASPMGIFVR